MKYRDLFMEELRFETQECVYAVYLDQKCEYLKKQLITRNCAVSKFIVVNSYKILYNIFSLL